MHTSIKNIIKYAGRFLLGLMRFLMSEKGSSNVFEMLYLLNAYQAVKYSIIELCSLENLVFLKYWRVL